MDFQERQLHPQLMAVPGIYNIIEFATLVNLVKLRLCLIAVLSFMFYHYTKNYFQGQTLPDFGVLTRFRTEEVAFMGDIEAMFHHVSPSAHP